jgi:hypothetical protein
MQVWRLLFAYQVLWLQTAAQLFLFLYLTGFTTLALGVIGAARANLVVMVVFHKALSNFSGRNSHKFYVPWVVSDKARDPISLLNGSSSALSPFVAEQLVAFHQFSSFWGLSWVLVLLVILQGGLV